MTTVRMLSAIPLLTLVLIGCGNGAPAPSGGVPTSGPATTGTDCCTDPAASIVPGPLQIDVLVVIEAS